jgi:SAM-dependent methyltransferase
MSDQREFWNERFAKEGYFYGLEPNLYVASHIDAFNGPKKILFLGEGEGRNAIYAARAGHEVTALDASDIGLAKCAERSRAENLSVNLILTDLEVWNPDERYDAVLCSFLHLPEPLRSDVYAKVLDALNPGGLFAGEFFSIHQMPRTTGGPKDETLLYTAAQLQEIFDRHAGCTVLELAETETELNEGRGHIGVASVVRMAVRRV